MFLYCHLCGSSTTLQIQAIYIQKCLVSLLFIFMSLVTSDARNYSAWYILIIEHCFVQHCNKKCVVAANVTYFILEVQAKLPMTLIHRKELRTCPCKETMPDCSQRQPGVAQPNAQPAAETCFTRISKFHPRTPFFSLCQPSFIEKIFNPDKGGVVQPLKCVYCLILFRM